MTSVEWYYARGNKQMGPVSAVELKRLATAGELRPEDLVWKEGMTEWSVARNVRGLFEEEGKPATAAAGPPAAKAGESAVKIGEPAIQPAAAAAAAATAAAGQGRRAGGAICSTCCSAPPGGTSTPTSLKPRPERFGPAAPTGCWRQWWSLLCSS